MNRFLIIVSFFLLHTIPAKADFFKYDIQYLRNNLTEILSKEEKIKSALNGISGDHSALGKAYKGLLISTLAEYAFWPNEKLSHFSEGKKMIEAAITENKNNAEIRFIRMLVQCKAPSFVGYHDQIPSDLQLIKTHFAAKKTEFPVAKYILSNIKMLECLSDAEKVNLNKLIAAY